MIQLHSRTQVLWANILHKVENQDINLECILTSNLDDGVARLMQKNSPQRYIC